MAFIRRNIDVFLQHRMFSGKVLVVYGPRQAGKTTAIMHYLSEHLPAEDVLALDGDELDICETLARASVERLRLLIGRKKVVFIDEAQRIPDIGLLLKRFHDHIPEVQVIASGSSSEELASRTEEALTGRKFEYTMLPLSFSELAEHATPLEECRSLEARLVYGAYPDPVSHPGDEVARIREIGRSYLYKDVLKYEEIRRPEILDRLLRALAFQIGQEVSYAELAQLTCCDAKTVSKYIDILEKAFVVFRLGSYSGNLRNELKKSQKVYFWDLGIRNQVLGDWRPLLSRGVEETGHLWENHVVAERAKWRLRNEPDTRAFFWRTAQKQEVDLVETTAAGLRAFEIKWSPEKAARGVSRTFMSAYPHAQTFGISPRNFFEFLV